MDQRQTIQRQLILDTVRELNDHATAEQVYAAIILKYPSMSKATVYRNLNQMSEAGELLRISNLDGSARYDHNRHNHYHFMCEQCKRVFDIDDYFDDIPERIKNPNRFEITTHSITFCGVCSSCKSGGES